VKEGAGITLGRGDIHYVVTEYGIAYLHGKNIRERAMDLISIAHPKFRPMLIGRPSAGTSSTATSSTSPAKEASIPSTSKRTARPAAASPCSSGRCG